MNDIYKEMTSLSGKIKLTKEQVKTIASLDGEINNLHNGIQVKFPHIYCDFICFWGSYGGESLLWELMPNPEKSDDVQGHLTFEQAIEGVKIIKNKKESK